MRQTLFMLLAILCLSSFTTKAHNDTYYRFRVQLRDKKHNAYNLKQPEQFLSIRALERRKRYGIKVDSYDLPVSEVYLNKLRHKGFTIHNKSNWLNTVVVETNDSAQVRKLQKLPFVSDIRWVWKGEPFDTVHQTIAIERKEWVDSVGLSKLDSIESADYYGLMQPQVEMLQTQKLHKENYLGQGMVIAVIDGGFQNADIIPNMSHIKVLGTKNFAEPNASVYDLQSHGMMVLSCMAADTPYKLVGTAPKAEYYLLQSEDSRTEQLVEEDNFVAALEYADSVGADIVTASLGYTGFDYKEMNPTYAQLDGRTALNSRGASLVASRGMILLNSAGNEGNDRWKKIGFPADATDILSVGALDSKKRNTDFSSLGYTADRRVKPDVMAMGEDDVVFNVDGGITYVNGTSFSCPIMAGAIACLWQAHRALSPLQLMQLVRESGNYYEQPNEVYGYGLPDIWKVHCDLLQKK